MKHAQNETRTLTRTGRSILVCPSWYHFRTFTLTPPRNQAILGGSDLVPMIPKRRRLPSPRNRQNKISPLQLTTTTHLLPGSSVNSVTHKILPRPQNKFWRPKCPQSAYPHTRWQTATSATISTRLIVTHSHTLQHYTVRNTWQQTRIDQYHKRALCLNTQSGRQTAHGN